MAKRTLFGLLLITGLSTYAQDTGWKNLTLRQKIGQTMLMLPDRQLELKLGGGSLKKYFNNYPVGGFFMGWKLWQGISEADKLSHIQKTTLEYQAASSLPLLFQEDYESGINIPGMTSFPNEMSLGAANSPELAYAYGAAVAKECRSIGVKWVLHPVADLNLNPLNPITNVRSIGDDPDRAIRLLSEQIRGLQDNGIAATVKHFPGDGVDSRDQHLLTSCNSLSLDVWKQKHGKVFQALIDSGVACIMPGHITLPAYQQEKINGFYPPATLSKQLLTNLLKGEMHFKGVIVSDAMTMGGFRGYYKDDLEGQIQSFLAGVDILLWPSYAFMDTVEARIKRGEIPMERLDDAVQRIWALKQRFGILEKNRQLFLPLTAEDKKQAEQTAAAISEQAVTLVRDRSHSLPLDPKKDKKILVVAIVPTGRKGGDIQLQQVKDFAQDLRNKGFTVDFRHNILYETQGWMDDAASRYDRIVAVVARYPHYPFGPLQLWDDEAQSIWAINSLPKEKIIAISFGSPYTVNEYFQRVNTCINAYSNTPVMHHAVIRALTGETTPKGVSPVDLSSYDPPANDTLSKAFECRPRAGLPNLFNKLNFNKPITIAWLGGSITQAANGYREQSTAWLQKRYPRVTITAINAGVGGTRSDLGAFRLKSQVLDHHPDLVFVEFAVNDKDTDPVTIHKSMEGIVRQIWKADPLTDICFVYTMTADMAPILRKGQLPPAARAMEDIAEYYHIPSVDMCLEVVKLYSEDRLIFKGKPEDYPNKLVFSTDNVHPYPQTGHRLYTEALTRSLQQMASLDQPRSHNLPPALSANRLENVQMIPAGRLATTGQWTTVPPSKDNAGALSPDPFPTLLKTTQPGSAMIIKFNGTMVGLYDVIGPGTGTWDIILDGRPYPSITRFDAFATYWRPHYVLLSDLPPGDHTVEFRLSSSPPDKRTLLAANAADYDANPAKYRETAGYAGFLLLAGKLTTPTPQLATPAPQPKSDWLITPPTQHAEVTAANNNKDLILSNGLFKRTFRLQPNLACTGFSNTTTGQELLRSVKAEARITINGKTYSIGGLHGQHENAYLVPATIDTLKAGDNDFQYQSYTTTPLKPYINWKPVGWAGNHNLPAGLELTFSYQSNLPELKGITVQVHYEAYDGIPLLVKYLTVDNKGTRSIRLDRVVNEILGVVEEESSVEGSKEQMATQHALYIETNYAFNNAGVYHLSDQTTHWKADSSYTSQVHYRYQTPCLLETYPEHGPGVVLKPGDSFRSVRTQELLIDTYDRERRGLSIRRMYRTLMPWTTENPIFMHLVSRTDDEVRTAVHQCAATGYEMLILSFGSHCNMEDTSAANIKKWKTLAAYAHQKGIRIGGYSLFSSRRISDSDDVIDPVTGKPDAAAFFGLAPCLGSKWGLAYLEKLKYFISHTGFDLLEHDGPYPGDLCASVTHPGHLGLEDSQWKQMELQKSLYRWCNEHGVYVNAPDWYFADGINKIPLGYREVNFALSRDQQKILNRQNIYDGLWDKIPSMGYGFVPLTEYHGGGPESVLEPLSLHLTDYRQLMIQYYGAGVQACYRGPRLYDTDSTRTVVTRVIDWYRLHREILNGDIIHLRRADGKDWDGIMHVDAAGREKALVMLYNPLDHPIERSIDLPLYYTGLIRTANVRVEAGPAKSYTLDRSFQITVDLTIPANGYTWFLIEDPASSTWMGFKRTDTLIAGRPCLIISPPNPMPGNPWIWRTEFFGHEPQGDSTLAAKGFHVVYMDIQNMYGAPAAMTLMDSFYNYLTTTWQLNKKTVLEGFSRGGLYAFNWAALHPNQVSCLYVDAPVCDFKSWPAGKGKGQYSKDDWQLLQKAYGFTSEQQALVYRGNPIDNLQPLAKAHIPILCVCGDADTIVPMPENIDIVKKRYQRMGGSIQMIVKPNNGHHPHSLKDPTPIVDFIMNETTKK